MKKSKNKPDKELKKAGQVKLEGGDPKSRGVYIIFPAFAFQDLMAIPSTSLHSSRNY